MHLFSMNDSHCTTVGRSTDTAAILITAECTLGLSIDTVVVGDDARATSC